jgi:late competence protein required for DNA uptake (superfamily II DNA/RNA helicase)
MIRSCQTLLEFVTVSERYRKEFSEKLRLSLAKGENYRNQIIELTQNKKILMIQTELVEGKLSMIFESVNQITNAKNMEDKHKILVN